jgi:hypothetical protein
MPGRIAHDRKPAFFPAAIAMVSVRQVYRALLRIVRANDLREGNPQSAIRNPQ